MTSPPVSTRGWAAELIGDWQRQVVAMLREKELRLAARKASFYGATSRQTLKRRFEDAPRRTVVVERVERPRLQGVPEPEERTEESRLEEDILLAYAVKS